jgi:hypothetical protein
MVWTPKPSPTTALIKKEYVMQYNKAVEIENLKENAAEVLRSVGGLAPEDAMNALGAAVSHIVIQNWAYPDRVGLLDAWFSMVRSSLTVAGSTGA